MGFQEGRPLKNLVYGITHPFQMAKEKPFLFAIAVGGGVYFLGIAMGWWPNVLFDLLRNLKK